MSKKNSVDSSYMTRGLNKYQEVFLIKGMIGKNIVFASDDGLHASDSGKSEIPKETKEGKREDFEKGSDKSISDQ